MYCTGNQFIIQTRSNNNMTWYAVQDLTRNIARNILNYMVLWYEIAFLIPLGIEIFGKGLQQGESFCPQSKFYHQASGPKKLQLHLKKYTQMVA